MKSKSDLIELFEEALAFLRNEDQQEPEQPKPLLTGPCIAKTRGGEIVFVQRCFYTGFPFIYKNTNDQFIPTCNDSGLVQEEQDDCDIVEVVRMLSDQEVLDWQFRGIEPELSVASEPVAKGFENSDVGRKEAEAMGLVYLGTATERQDLSLPGELYVYDLVRWQEKSATDSVVYPGSTYAYKPAT